MKKSIHQFKVKNAKGSEIDLEEYKGKVVLVVNTASKCGFTPQLEKLEALYKEYKNDDFVILGFPSNDFANQEPLEGEKAEEFCQINYGVSFPIMEKVHVKGDQQHPLFKFLSNKSENGKVNSIPKWNFHKYLVNKEGEVVDYFYTITSPTSGKIKKSVKKLLS